MRMGARNVSLNKWPSVKRLMILLQGGFSDFRHTMSSAAAAKEETPLSTQQRQMLCGTFRLVTGSFAHQLNQELEAL